MTMKDVHISADVAKVTYRIPPCIRISNRNTSVMRLKAQIALSSIQAGAEVVRENPALTITWVR
jgi:hypothetical protein